MNKPSQMVPGYDREPLPSTDPPKSTVVFTLPKPFSLIDFAMAFNLALDDAGYKAAVTVQQEKDGYKITLERTDLDEQQL